MKKKEECAHLSIIIKLTFSDRYPTGTQVVFHAKKKALKEASASWPPLAPATLPEEGLVPGKLVQDLEAAWTNCWTRRYAQARLYSSCTMIHPTQCV